MVGLDSLSPKGLDSRFGDGYIERFVEPKALAPQIHHAEEQAEKRDSQDYMASPDFREAVRYFLERHLNNLESHVDSIPPD
jgi:hypothetical protein